jgi:hypothetical protein
MKHLTPKNKPKVSEFAVSPERPNVKVFISSLISGMEQVRAAAREAVTTLRHEPVMAEDFGAQQDSPQVACLTGLREADVVVLILGERYGAPQQSPDPRREKENQADPENQSHHHPGSPLRHKQEERSRPDYGQRWRPAEPDAGPVTKSGFHGGDEAAESYKVYRCDTKWTEVVAT